MSKPLNPRRIKLPTAKEDQAITRAARADPDAQPLTPAQLSGMLPLRRLRGRPKAAASKQLLSVRYSPEVIGYFRSTGQGWQSRMNEVLKAYVHRQERELAGKT
jgi:uncharacterized protein (DUF4415 family)